MSETKVAEKSAEGQAGIIRINEEKIHGHLDEMVRSTVEETLNGMLEAEAEKLVGAGRYERSEGRRDTRAGHYERNLDTKAGRVKIKMPKLRKLAFETAIVERYRRRESSVEEALIEMYLAGVSVRRVEDITEALWGTRVSSGTVSRLNQKIYGKIEQWRMRPIEAEHPMVYLDGISMKRTWGPVRCAMYRSWWPLPSTKRAIGRSSASPRVPRRTRRVGRTSEALLYLGMGQEYFEEHGVEATAANTLTIPLWAFLSKTDDCDGAILRAVNIGYDTDTFGATTGAIAGAYHGLSHLPCCWIDSLENEKKGRDYVLLLADK